MHREAILNFHPIERDAFLLPPDMSHWLAPGHLAHFVIEVVEMLDLSAFTAKFRTDGVGATAYHPKILVGVLLYGYSQGVRSSRQIERHCQEDVAYRIIAANQQPDHSTISRFVASREKELSELFVQALKMCAAAGLVKVGTLSLDGTKLKASAALDGNRTRSKLEEEIAAILAEARQEDRREDGLYGDWRGDELPPELSDPRGRRARLQACLERVKETEEQPRIEQTRKIEAWETRNKQGPEPTALQDLWVKAAKANVTDPDSRVMKTRSGLIQGYNAQVMVTEEQIIVAADVTQQESDKLQLQPMVQQTRTNVAVLTPRAWMGTVLTDAGYYSEANGRSMEEQHVDWLSATKKRWKIEATESKRLSECLTYKDLLERRIRTDKGRMLYRTRGMTVEPVIGQIKEVQNARRCSRRGIKAVRSEWRLTCAVHNLLKLYRARKSKGI
jgi:transposase